MSRGRQRRLGVIVLIIWSTAVLAFPHPTEARPGVRRAAATSISRPAPRPVAPPVRTGERIDAADRRGVDRDDRAVRAGDDVKIDIDNDGGWDDDRHPVAAGVVIGAVAAARATPVVIGTVAYSVPSDCATSIYANESYYTCDGVWYAPEYQGDKVVYVVVEDPSQ